MQYTVIEVPDMNDSMSRVVLNGTAYYIRFTYNHTGDFWKFGVYDSQKEPILVGMKIVPRFPLNVYYGVTKLPSGYFGVKTKLDHIGRRAFADGEAKFVFIPS